MLLLGVAAPATADYQVLLKSGETLYARDYWLDKVDKELIRLDIDGSTRRVPRDGVRYIAPLPEEDPRARIAIKRITFAPREKLAALVEAPREGDAALAESDGSAEGSAGMSAAETAATSADGTVSAVGDPPAMDEFWREEAERIDEQREAAKDEFKAALAGDDLAARQQARQKILDLTDARTRLREEVR
ncbi:MAG: hypothetical protein RBT64_11705, partial [Trichloromonas sp.]|nr:hypothetical protein [Trichloromonas sp.]